MNTSDRIPDKRELEALQALPVAMQDIDERFTILALRALHDFLKRDDGLPKRWDLDRINKAGTPVRREFLLALRDFDAALAREAIYTLAKLYDGKDRFYLEAIGIAVGHYDKARRDIILADFEKQFPTMDEKTLDLIWELQPPSVMPKLGKALSDKSLTGAVRGRIVDILAASNDAGAGKTMLDVLQSDVPPEVRDKVLANVKLFLPNKWSNLRNSKELNDAIATRPNGSR